MSHVTASADAAARHTFALEALGIHHAYDGEVALHDVDLVAAEGEFTTLLGPSGSGKTTLLRIFAGLLAPTAGRIHIGGRDVSDVSVQDRNVGFVFQNYALFPHLTVTDNVAFPLKTRGVEKSERARRVADMLDLVGLTGLEGRYPAQLSGGQQQRVAVARALVFEPKLLLLDEPLGALDRALRQQLGRDVRRIQRETATTAIYVTHDQEEAFLLSDTVVVLDQGQILQQGRPVDVYRQPSNMFVARFLGDTNVLSGRVERATARGAVLDVAGAEIECSGGEDLGAGTAASCSLRPEDVEVFLASDSTQIPADECVLGDATVQSWEFLGSRFRLLLEWRGRGLVVELPGAATLPEERETVTIGCRPGAAVVVD
jgi:ABC-type Fe3+/spermidine/putrescine transport system ATPase subunit